MVNVLTFFLQSFIKDEVKLLGMVNGFGGVAHWRKGWPASKDIQVWDPKKKRYVSYRHKLAALGVSTKRTTPSLPLAPPKIPEIPKTPLPKEPPIGGEVGQQAQPIEGRLPQKEEALPSKKPRKVAELGIPPQPTPLDFDFADIGLR